ncbi:MAG: hypothetical protein ACK5V3_00975 [Bdellovibrionales bacterium]
MFQIRIQVLFLAVLFLGSFAFSKKIETVEDYQDYVKETVEKKKSSIKKKCVKDKKISGRMNLIWKLTEKGEPVEFTRGKDSVDNLDIYHCYEKELSKIKFKKPPVNEFVDIKHEFFF